MDFAYDPEKSGANKEQYGIDFEEAQQLWFDEGDFSLLLEIQESPGLPFSGNVNRRFGAVFLPSGMEK